MLPDRQLTSRITMEFHQTIEAPPADRIAVFPNLIRRIGQRQKLILAVRF